MTHLFLVAVSNNAECGGYDGGDCCDRDCTDGFLRMWRQWLHLHRPWLFLLRRYACAYTFGDNPLDVM